MFSCNAGIGLLFLYPADFMYLYQLYLFLGTESVVPCDNLSAPPVGFKNRCEMIYKNVPLKKISIYLYRFRYRYRYLPLI